MCIPRGIYIWSQCDNILVPSYTYVHSCRVLILVYGGYLYSWIVAVEINVVNYMAFIIVTMSIKQRINCVVSIIMDILKPCITISILSGILWCHKASTVITAQGRIPHSWSIYGCIYIQYVRFNIYQSTKFTHNYDGSVYH